MMQSAAIQADPNRYHAGCGGEIAITGCGDSSRIYCTRCAAYMMLVQPFPTGTNPVANSAALDNRAVRSPDNPRWEWVPDQSNVMGS